MSDAPRHYYHPGRHDANNQIPTFRRRLDSSPRRLPNTPRPGRARARPGQRRGRVHGCAGVPARAFTDVRAIPHRCSRTGAHGCSRRSRTGVPYGRSIGFWESLFPARARCGDVRCQVWLWTPAARRLWCIDSVSVGHCRHHHEIDQARNLRCFNLLNPIYASCVFLSTNQNFPR